MQSFRDVYAATQEVKCIDDALVVARRDRWPQWFGLNGDSALCLCVDGILDGRLDCVGGGCAVGGAVGSAVRSAGGVVVLKSLVCQNPDSWFVMVKELAKACADANLSLRVDCPRKTFCC